MKNILYLIFILIILSCSNTSSSESTEIFTNETGYRLDTIYSEEGEINQILKIKDSLIVEMTNFKEGFANETYRRLAFKKPEIVGIKEAFYIKISPYIIHEEDSILYSYSLPKKKGEKIFKNHVPSFNVFEKNRSVATFRDTLAEEGEYYYTFIISTKNNEKVYDQIVTVPILVKEGVDSVKYDSRNALIKMSKITVAEDHR